MWFFYVVAAIAAVFAAAMWASSRRIAAWECAASAVTGFAMAIIFQISANISMTQDVEVWSGRINQVRHNPAWTEYYEEAIYRTEYRMRPATVSDGKGGMKTVTRRVAVQVFDHWEPRQRSHAATWVMSDTLGQRWAISAAEYAVQLRNSGGQTTTVRGDRTTGSHASRMVEGDPNDYLVSNVTGWIQPTTQVMSWTNRVKAAPSQFSFPTVPQVERSTIYPWPEPSTPFVSGRVLGDTRIDALAWDQLNARIGPTKYVNLIAIGFGQQPKSVAEVQRAAWLGGKKNDLVVTCGGDPAKPAWARVFGWSESDDCKRRIEGLVMTHGLTSALIAPLEAEVTAHYVIKDWTKLDYLTVEPPTWSYWAFLGVLALVQGGLWLYFFNNEHQGRRLSHAT